MSKKRQESRQWRPIETPHGVVEFGTRNQAHADYNAFKSKHKKVFRKKPEPEITFSESWVTKRIKGEKHECYEYKAVLKTSISLFNGTFIGKSLVSREDAMKMAVDLANAKFPKSKTSHKKERGSGVVRRFGKMRLKKVFRNVLRRA